MPVRVEEFEMAERSFKKEVQQLRIGAGEEFRGEGILAVTKALLQSGVGYVAGYQGSPISHLMDVLADANDILQELGVHFEASASEATAAATLAASVMYPIRGAVTWKSTVGTNVASDALANLASGGVTGGSLHLAQTGTATIPLSNATERVWCVTLGGFAAGAELGSVSGLDGYDASGIVADADGKLDLIVGNRR